MSSHQESAPSRTDDVSVDPARVVAGGRSPVAGAPVGRHDRPTLRTLAPFMAMAVAGVAAAGAWPPHTSLVTVAVMFGVFAVVIACEAVSLRRVTPSWIDPVAPFLFFLVVALARHASGGSTSGLTTLVALPILWLALTGTRRQVMTAGVLTASVFIIPLVAIGAPVYGANDWPRAMIWSALALLVAPMIHRVVEQLGQESRRANATGAQLEQIMQGARLTSIISTDAATGLITSFSIGAEELLGYPAGEMVGLHDPGVLHDPTEIADVAAELAVEPGIGVFTELARRGAPSRNWTYVRRDGARIRVRLAVTELRDDEGVVTGHLGVAVDITQAEAAQRALSQSEARWRLAVDHLPDATLITVDEHLMIEMVSGGGVMRHGLEGAEGAWLGDYSKPENLALLADAVARALTGEVVTVEMRDTATDAEHQVVAIALPSEEGDPRVLIKARDVSQERQRERAETAARAQAERLFSDAPHGVALLSLDGVILRSNDALNDIAGEMPGALDGMKLDAFSASEDESLADHLERTVAGHGQLVESDWVMRATQGNDVYVLVSSRRLDRADGDEDLLMVNVVDVSDRRRYEIRLAHLADHDALTGLANRRLFDHELARHLERCERYGPTGALLLLDLDNFKEVNDTLGHGVGDQLIISAANLLRTGVRSTDIVARLGGDEFAILLPEADRAEAETVARMVVERIREFTSTLEGTRRRVTASVGVVTLKAAQEHSADLLALADMTMYDAKDAGRDGYVVLDEQNFNQPRSGARLEWRGRIEAALEEDNFTLHLQPILDLATGAVRSAEALLRLSDTDELVLPSRFLYIAERTGLAPALDCWVVEKSVSMLAELRRHAPDFQLEVNLSGHSIGHHRIEETIVDALGRHAVDPAALILEITETAAVADVELAREFAERITTLGCRFALDDFGAGFGSFYYLKHLLFDYVKIDGEFVANCHRSSVDRSIMRSIVGIAHDLGKKTVAEFVSDPAILEVVREEGVDLAQGYLIGEAVPYDEFVARFLENGAGSAPAPYLVAG